MNTSPERTAHVGESAVKSTERVSQRGYEMDGDLNENDDVAMIEGTGLENAHSKGV